MHTKPLGVICGLLAAFFGVAIAAADSCCPTEAAPEKGRLVILKDDFESGTLDKWASHSEGVSVVAEGGTKACRIERGGRLVLDLPSEKLSHKRLWFRCRYRLAEAGDGKTPSKARLRLTWTDSLFEKGRKRYGGGALPLPTKADTWQQFESVTDMTRGVADAKLELNFQGSDGDVLIDDVEIVAIPQRMIPVVGYKPATKDKLIFEDNFDGDLSNWIHEGIGSAEVKAGRLEVFVTPDLKEKRGQNLWLKQKLPEDFIAEMAVTVHSPRPGEKRPCNLLWFFNATRKGGNLLGTTAERDGWYDKYIGKKAIIPCYTFTWYRLSDPHFVIARRNPGWSESGRNFPAIPKAGKEYIIRIEKRGRQMVLVENGTAVLLINDSEEPLGPGYFAMRSWHAKASYDYVRIYTVGK